MDNKEIIEYLVNKFGYRRDYIVNFLNSLGINVTNGLAPGQIILDCESYYYKKECIYSFSTWNYPNNYVLGGFVSKLVPILTEDDRAKIISFIQNE